MGLIWNFFGLLFGSGYTASKLLSENRATHRYEHEMALIRQKQLELKMILLDSELERVAENFISNGSKSDITNLLTTELEYIANGNEAIIEWFLRQKPLQLDCILSHFGKLSFDTVVFHSNMFGLLVNVFEQYTEYDISVRVLQCIESNLKKATGETILFGADCTISGAGINGKYPSSYIAICGTVPKLFRPYQSVDIPFTKISRESLEIV